MTFHWPETRNILVGDAKDEFLRLSRIQGQRGSGVGTTVQGQGKGDRDLFFRAGVDHREPALDQGVIVWLRHLLIVWLRHL